MKLKAMLRCGVVAALSMTAAVVPLGTGAAQDATLTSASTTLNLGVGKGTLVRMNRPVTDVFVANQAVADVQVRSAQQIYVFGKGGGETSVYATDGAGRIVYSANVRVVQNIDQVRNMLSIAMPGAAIEVNSLSGMTLLTGTVSSPDEVEEATRLVQTLVGKDQAIINKLKTATPMQVNLRVQVAEVSRTLLKELGLNLQAIGTNSAGGINFLVGRGRDFIQENGDGTSTIITRPDVTNIFGDANFLGLNIAGMIDALENDGLVSLLAEPNLTALSGETASFLAGGEFPIAVSDGNGGISVEFKEFGVSVAFTPTVLDGSRISMRVRPEVSELSEAGAIRLNNVSIPALSTRKAETSVELGSGQSFMIAGLLRNRLGTAADKTPILGDIPIIGALFKSDRYQRDETELVFVITPYLVKPTNTRLALPTDALAAPNDAERWLFGKTFKGGKEPPATNGIPATDAPAGASGGAAPGFSN